MIVQRIKVSGLCTVCNTHFDSIRFCPECGSSFCSRHGRIHAEYAHEGGTYDMKKPEEA